MNTTAKHFLIPCIIVSVLAACGKKEQPGIPQDSTAAPQDTAMVSADTVAAPYVFFNIDSLRTVLDAGKHQIDLMLSDPSRVKGYIGTLPGNDPTSIPYAIHYIKHHPAPAGSPTYDTLYKEFRSLYYLVSVAYSNAVSGPTLTPVLEKPESDPEHRNLIEYLKLYALTVYAQEGFYYVDADPKLYAEIFHMKDSPQLKYFLYLQEKDLSQGLYSDGGMTLSYQQLYQRIEGWGLFISAHPNFLLTRDALGSYRGYLSALLTGDDNSPVFDSQTKSIIPEIKTIYENIMTSGKDHVSKKIITDYYNLLSRNNFKQTDDVNTFLDKYDIAALFAQPI